MVASTADKLLNIVKEIDTSGCASLTRLTVLKKWFERPQRLAAFAVWLANRIISEHDAKTDGVEETLFEVARAVFTVDDPANPVLQQEAARKLYHLLRKFQNEYEKQAWGPVRIIHNWNLLLVEEALGICLGFADSPSQGYRLAADYCRHYNPHYGDALSGPARTKIEDIACFVAEIEAWEHRQARI